MTTHRPRTMALERGGSTRVPHRDRFRQMRIPTARAIRDYRYVIRFARSREFHQSHSRYVITMASRASDMLAVELLQRVWHRCAPARRPAVRDRDCECGASSILLAMPDYRAHPASEVMVGYPIRQMLGVWRAGPHRARGQIGRRLTHGEAALFHGRGGALPRQRTDASGDHVATRRLDYGTLRDEQGRDATSVVQPPDIARCGPGIYTSGTRPEANCRCRRRGRVACMHGPLHDAPRRLSRARPSSAFRRVSPRGHAYSELARNMGRVEAAGPDTAMMRA